MPPWPLQQPLLLHIRSSTVNALARIFGVIIQTGEYDRTISKDNHVYLRYNAIPIFSEKFIQVILVKRPKYFLRDVRRLAMKSREETPPRIRFPSFLYQSIIRYQGASTTGRRVGHASDLGFTQTTLFIQYG